MVFLINNNSNTTYFKREHLKNKNKIVFFINMYFVYGFDKTDNANIFDLFENNTKYSYSNSDSDY